MIKRLHLALALLLALLSVAPLSGRSIDAGAAEPAAEPPPPASASGFLFYKYPTVGSISPCAGVGLNVTEDPAYSRDDCGFAVFTVAEGGSGAVTVRLLGPDGTEFAAPEAAERDVEGEYDFPIEPETGWPAGMVTAEVSVAGVVAGSAPFFHNALDVGVVVGDNGGAPYAPGAAIPFTGTVAKLDNDGVLPPSDPGGATVRIALLTPEGDELWFDEIVAGADGAFSGSVPAGETTGQTGDPMNDYRLGLGVTPTEATYLDPSTGEWGLGRARAGGATLLAAPNGPVLENNFVSEVGWVKPDQGYPFRLLVRNFTSTPFAGVEVEVPEPDGTDFVDVSTSNGSATIGGDGTITWAVGASPAATGGVPSTATLVVQARADSLTEDDEIVWKDLSTTATLTYTGGPGAGVVDRSHGPKVIPPDERFDTARYGDRPFPVVPVDYLDRKHEPGHTGAQLSNVINDPGVEGSTFNLFQEMSYGQLFPEGTVPSSSFASADFDYGPGFDFTAPEPNGTCRGVTLAEAAGTPLYPERIQNGWYQLPGTTDYYGDDRAGSAIVGSATAVGPLMDIDSACGPAGKAVYDAAAIADPEIDYSDYDTDKDGVVDFFMMVFVGLGGNGVSQGLACPPDCPAPPYDNIWPHSSSLEFSYTDETTGLSGYVSDDQLKDEQGRPLYYTDETRTQMQPGVTAFPVHVRVGPYNVNPESSIDAASVISHEYGHSLGLPDFYSLGDRETYGTWNLMASDHSQHMDIFSRQELGWVVPEVLDEDTSIEGMVDSKQDTHRIVWQTPDGDEYVLEGDDVHNGQAYVAKLPSREIIDATVVEEQASGSRLWWSRSGNDFGCPPDGGHNLDIALPDMADVSAGTPVTLTFKSLWDIEWDYDYGFVMISTDGGQTYQSLESANGYTTPSAINPTANSCQQTFGNGITGTSGSYDEPRTDTADRTTGTYPEPVFLEDEYDLSEFAGDEVVLRFSYATDPGLARPGWFIDDLSVTAGTDELFASDFEASGDPDDPAVFNGGCKDDLTVASQCTDGWQYIDASAGSPADHAYYFELRDRTGFDLDGNGQSDRGFVDWGAGLSLVYTDEAHGYGNVGTDNPPAQSPLDAAPEPGSDTPDLSNAGFNQGERFSDDPADPHIDNYSDPRREPLCQSAPCDPVVNPEINPWLFDFGCLTLDVTAMAGDANGPPSAAAGDLTADVDVTVGEGCEPYDYGFGASEGGGGGGEGDSAPPTADAQARPTTAAVGQRVDFSGVLSTDDETSSTALQYSWNFADGTTGTGRETSHAFGGPGTYDVVLTVTDEDGGTDTDVIRITVFNNGTTGGGGDGTQVGGTQKVRGEGPDTACAPGFVPDPKYQDTATDQHDPRIRCIAWYIITLGTGDADGNGAQEYAPGASVTRAQMASFLVRLAHEAGVAVPASPPDRFDDDRGNIHETVINQAAALGIVQGRGGRTYDPEASVTRAEMAAFIARLHQQVRGSLPTPSRDHFDDDNGTTHEASINALAELGVIQGKGDLDGDGDIDFQPDGDVTRGQMATFIANELGVLVTSGDVEPGGAEVFLNGTTAARGGQLTGNLETNKTLNSLTANGCGLTNAAVTVAANGDFTIQLPAGGTAGACELSLDAVTSRTGVPSTQSVRWLFDVTLT